MKELMRGVFSDMIAFHTDPDAWEVKPGSAPPPREIEESLSYFVAVHAGHHTKFAEHNDHTRRKLYEAINGHRDWTAGTPIASWAGRAKHDQVDLIAKLNLALALMVE